MRVVGVTGGEFLLSSSAANTTPIPLDTTTALDRGKCIPIPGGNFFGLDIVSTTTVGAGSRRRMRQWGYIPSLNADGLNMHRRKADNAAANEDDTGSCHWLEFTEGGVAEGLVRGILTFDGITGASSVPTSVESFNGTWPANVVDANKLIHVHAFTSKSNASSADHESHLHISRTGTTFTVTPGGVTPDYDVVVWVLELTGAAHSVQTLEFAHADYQSQKVAAPAYVEGGPCNAGDVFSAPTDFAAASPARYVCTNGIAVAPDLVEGVLTPENVATFAHLIGWDTESFELTLPNPVNWGKSIILPGCWSHTEAVSNPMDNAQLVARPGSANNKISCDIGYPDSQRTDPASRKGSLQVWTFDDPAIVVQQQMNVLGSTSAGAYLGDLTNDRPASLALELQEPDSGENDAVGTFFAWAEQNSDDRTESDLMAGNYGAVLSYADSVVIQTKRRSFVSLAQRLSIRAMTGLDKVTADTQPEADFEILVSGNSQSYTIRATLAVALPGGDITTLNATLGDTLTAKPGATDSVAEFDVIADEHSAGGALEHTVTGRATELRVSNATDQSQISSATLPASWQIFSSVTQAESPSESIARLITDLPAKLGDIFDAYGSGADPGRVTEEGRPYNAVAPFPLTVKLYDVQNQIWSAKYDLIYTAQNFITADNTRNLNAPAGLWDWTTIGAIDTGASDWVSDGDCVFPENSNQPGDIQFPNIRLTEDRVSVILLYGRVDDNDTIGPGIFTAPDYLNGNYGEISTNGTGNPDRFEFKRRTAGVQINLDYAIFPTLGPDNALELELFKPNGTFTLYRFAADGTRTPIKQFVDQTHSFLEYPGFPYEARNTNGSCLKAYGFNGESALQVSAVNGEVGVATIQNGLNTVTFTEDYAPPSVDVSDEKDVVRTFAATVVGPREVSFIAVMNPLWKGAVELLLPNGLKRGANYPAPAGFKSTNFGPDVSTPMTTASWSARGQVTLPVQTLESRALSVFPTGHAHIAGGDLPQSAMIGFNDGSGYTSAVREWFYPLLIPAVAPIQLLVTEAVNLDLGTIYPLLAIPANELGSSGNGWSIATPNGLPGSLSRADTVLSGTLPAGTTDIAFDITTPDGRTLRTTLRVTMLVIDAVVGGLAIQSVMSAGTLSLLPVAAPGGMAMAVVMTAAAVTVLPAAELGGMVVPAVMTPGTPTVTATEKLLNAGERLAVQIY